MLNPALLHELPAEFKILYQSRVKIANTYLLRDLTKHIRGIRQRHRPNRGDKLAEKSARYGNKGGWYRSLVVRLAQDRAERKLNQAPRQAQSG